MALKKSTTFKDGMLRDITGEYWRISNIVEGRPFNGSRPLIVTIELWVNEADRNSEDPHPPLWSGSIALPNISMEDSNITDIYTALKQLPQWSGATDV